MQKVSELVHNLARDSDTSSDDKADPKARNPLQREATPKLEVAKDPNVPQSEPPPETTTREPKETKEEAAEEGDREEGDSEGAQADSIFEIQRSLEVLVRKQQTMAEQVQALQDELRKEKRQHVEERQKKPTEADIAKAQSTDPDIFMGYPKDQLPTLWIPDDFTKMCQKCKGGFGCLFSGPRHCRNCGGLFCASCCAELDFVPPFYCAVKVLVCTTCAASKRSQRLAARQQA